MIFSGSWKMYFSKTDIKKPSDVSIKVFRLSIPDVDSGISEHVNIFVRSLSSWSDNSDFENVTEDIFSCSTSCSLNVFVYFLISSIIRLQYSSCNVSVKSGKKLDSKDVDRIINCLINYLL